MPAAFSDAAGIFVSLGGKARYPAAPPRLPVTAAFTRSRPQGGKPAIPQPPPEPASAAFYPFPPAGRKARHPAASAGTGVCRLLPVPARRAESPPSRSLRRNRRLPPFTRSRPQGGKAHRPAGKNLRGNRCLPPSPVPARRAGRPTARQEKTSAGTGVCQFSRNGHIFLVWWCMSTEQKGGGNRHFSTCSLILPMGQKMTEKIWTICI